MRVPRRGWGGLLFLLLACSPGVDGTSTPTSVGALERSGWSALHQAPSEDQLRCAWQRTDFWSVSLAEEALSADPRPTGVTRDPLPFSPGTGRDRAGHRHVLEVSDGWLVGFDAGEFGGGLWWFSPDGARSSRVSLPESTPVLKDDPFRAENVRGFTSFNGEVLVFMGLDHLLGTSGHAFRLTRTAGEWGLVPIATFDASPSAWTVEERRVFVVTQGGLWTIGESWEVDHVHSVDLDGLAPASLVRDSDGVLYVSLRHYLLSLRPVVDQWTERWYAPPECVRFRVENECECVPEEG